LQLILALVLRGGMVFALDITVHVQRNEIAMLRITAFDRDTSNRVVKLEGKLLHAWVNEVRNHFVGTDAESFPRLDLSGVSYVDRPGTELLQHLLHLGVRIESCSPYVAELLHWDRKPNP
jgi:hypothetical protein